ncbi:hypothetical protein [Pleurocapsa sp. FMAR1]|uniref:hypothetical protein n=1 Tax=Pleurocapsa sp. FMAR1 TaxID=3040204 RepID=UPI0029C831D6|nr:hypothetical protein [Pleurocapsa sp. FMAR1]
MFDLEPIFEFSRHNCVAICSFLVPANLIATITTITLVVKSHSLSAINRSVGFASIFAIALFMHVSTWFMIGVVTPVTFILFGLGTSCLLINVLAIIYRRQIVQVLTASLSGSKNINNLESF